MGLFSGLTGWHLVAIVLVILVLFGATKLPIFAKGLGQSVKIFRKEMTEVQEDMAKDKAQRSEEHLDAEPVTLSKSQTRRASEDR